LTTMQKKPKLIVVLGPTASGKTKLSLEIGKQFNAEIISGDSMQVYRGMDIGTAKASEEERQAIPHHLIDIHEPDHAFSVSEFQQLAAQAAADITDRGHIPMIVGGTGLYIESFCYNYEFNPTGSDEHYRQSLQDFVREHGSQALYDKLLSVDTVAAERIHPNDERRIIRALEVYHLTGKPMSEQLRGQKKESPYELCIIGLTMDRKILYKRIEERIDQMIEEGLVEEVRSLLAQGYKPELVSMQGLGYKEIIQFIQDEYDWEEAVYLLKRNTRRFAKRQLSWFRHMNDIHWVDVTESENFSDHLITISGIITTKFNCDIK
jgi:tRNA dimethylallyltransferase